MTNPRLPTEKARLTGADVKNPGRHAGRSKHTAMRPIGEPYVKMTEDQKAQWFEFVRDLPWLNCSHRVLLRLACRLTVDMDGDDFGVSKAQALGSILSKLGATPADESKMKVPDGDEEPDEFFGDS
ncbi:MAG: hypothetical protein EON59_05700 [Alphaproteobacteria bacterium]|nr:MAG: hypothetical protein EON59_05700 [Alphaproteobacteria bacterium]